MLPTVRVLANRGPKTWEEDVAIREFATRLFVLTVPDMKALAPVMVEAVNDFTLATVCPRGKAKVLMMFQVAASFEEIVREA